MTDLERAERAEALAAELAGALYRYAEWMGPACLRNCPQDDTCNCEGKPINGWLRFRLKTLEVPR